MELVELQKKMKAGLLDDRIAFQLVLVDSSKLREPATTAYLSNYLESLEIDMAASVDPTFSTVGYFPSGGLPMQLVVSLPDMKILFAEAGPASVVDPVIDANLNGAKP